MFLDEDGQVRGAYRGNEDSHQQGVKASAFGGSENPRKCCDTAHEVPRECVVSYDVFG